MKKSEQKSNIEKGGLKKSEINIGEINLSKIKKSNYFEDWIKIDTPIFLIMVTNYFNL